MKPSALGDAIGEFVVAARRRRVLEEPEHPLMHAAEVGVAALRERAQQVERRGRLAIGLDLPARIGPARLLGEVVAVDDVAAVARQLDAVSLLGRRRPGFCELARDATDLHHRQGAREVSTTAICRKTRKKSRMLLAPCSAKLSAQSPPCSRKASPRATRATPSSGCAPRRQRPAAGRSRAAPRFRPAPSVRILRHLQDRFLAPAVRRPTLCLMMVSSGLSRIGKVSGGADY